jgi:hypothetical protein
MLMELAVVMALSPGNWDGFAGNTDEAEVNVSATLEDQHKLISSSNGSTATDTVYWRANPALCLLSDLTGFVTELARRAPRARSSRTRRRSAPTATPSRRSSARNGCRRATSALPSS